MQNAPWLSIVAWFSVAIGGATAGAIAIDVFRHPQRMKIMNVVWPITGLYFPLVGLLFYRSLGRPMAIDGDEHSHARWKGVFLSATHCGSGCAIGDLLGPPLILAVGLSFFGSPLVTEYITEFLLAYAAGIAFQYIPIRAMRKIPVAAAIGDAIKADTLSLIAFEIGMFGWMAVAYYTVFARAPHPDSVVFWFMMQIAMIFGFATTFPANWMLIRLGIKGAM